MAARGEGDSPGGACGQHFGMCGAGMALAVAGVQGVRLKGGFSVSGSFAGAIAARVCSEG